MRTLLSLLTLTLLLSGCGHKTAPPPSANDVKEFFAAVQDGDSAIVDRLLSAKPGLVNARNDAGETPLAVAKKQTESDVADTIRRHGGHE